ncbi:hypothetical protein [Paraburkholderia tuberum]|uniref:Heparinase II/III-like protein n=1 Tax=Paraburkholderia tuberum TaxID=157910 RepID=A0A1H1IVS2_9BURK|nr:hypothetical protein [Paraburkholderia tuberum]SDR41811.1 hypothetical protein SAMN05445850_3739 [Paraburkholderia tuberum]
MRFDLLSGTCRRMIAVCAGAVVCILSGASTTAQAESPNSATPSALLAAADQQLAEFAGRAGRSDSSVDTRDLVAAAWLLLQRNGDVHTAQNYALRAFAGQEAQPGSANFGWVPWRTTDHSIGDPNAIEFAAISLGPILHDYSDRLQPEALRTLRDRGLAALAALTSHQVKSTYTNIALMNATALMLLGQELGDMQAFRKGVHRFEAWRSVTGETGLREYGSPIYYAVDLATLTTLVRYVADTEVRNQGNMALNLLWADVAAHYFPQAARLAGAHSRVGHFYDSRGPIDVWAALAGIAPASDFSRAKTFDVITPFLLASTGPDGWRFPKRLTGFANDAPRDVVARWRDDDLGFRWTWVSHGASIGCANGYAGPQNELLTGIFSDDISIRQIGVTASTENPYGVQREADRFGHMKDMQKRFDVACVGHGGMAIVVLDGTAALKADDHFQIVLPTADRLSVNGQDVEPSVSLDRPVEANSVVVVSAPSGAIGIRVIPLPGSWAGAVAPRLQGDADGERLKLARLNLLPSGVGVAAARVALLIEASDSEVPAELAKRLQNSVVRADIHGNTVEIGMASGDTRLRLALDASSRFAPRALSVDGVPFGTDLLSINGREVGRPLWDGVGR